MGPRTDFEDNPVLKISERVAGLTYLCLKAYGFHEIFIIVIPDGIAVDVATVNNALHIVSQDIFGNTKIFETMKHSDEQALLGGIRE